MKLMKPPTVSTDTLPLPVLVVVSESIQPCDYEEEDEDENEFHAPGFGVRQCSGAFDQAFATSMMHNCAEF
jgi:hypothetical protein